MAIIKCKMCGGDLNITEGVSVAECEYCGSRQTIPSADNEKKMTLFTRAARLLRGCEFDKASGIFEAIVADFPEEAEAYWGLVLCKYGIEYVDDPATGKKVPTCHRSSFESVLDDPNFEQACEFNDAVARRVYRDEARQIEALRKRIIEVSGKEEPYDVFISYKETGADGQRTLDSVIAQDIYKELTREGYRVFFSRISLEGKLGVEYEPYIFAALNSSKVMLVVGTDYEHFDAVWVKNEWSRFLKLISSGEKKVLIPCFKDMDAYDMPKEFNKLSAQDMGKIGAMQDLLHGIEKIIPRKAEEKKETVIVRETASGGPNATALLKRGEMALQDGKWEDAKGYYDRVLDMDAECAEAYLGLYLVEERCPSADALAEKKKRALQSCSAEKKPAQAPDKKRTAEAVKAYAVKNYLTEETVSSLFGFDLNYDCFIPGREQKLHEIKQQLNGSRNLTRAEKFASGDVAKTVADIKSGIIAEAQRLLEKAKADSAAKAEEKRAAYARHLDEAEKKAAELHQKAEAKREASYNSHCRNMEAATEEEDFLRAARGFANLTDFRDAAEKARLCREKAAEAKREADRIAAEEAEKDRIAKEKAQLERKRKAKKSAIIAAVICVLIAVACFVFMKFILPAMSYKQAEKLLAEGHTAKAAIAFAHLGDYEDARERSLAAWDSAAQRDLISAGDDHSAAVRIEGTAAARGYNEYKQCAVQGWEALVSISAGSMDTVGLKADGTVVTAGRNFDGVCDDLYDIVAVSAGSGHAVGLRMDGTVVAVGRNFYGQCDVQSWTDIISVSAGSYHTVGLKSDGTVVAVGENDEGQCYVSSWSDIVAVSAGADHTVGLKADGTVVSTEIPASKSSLSKGQCDVDDWTDIVAISAGAYHTVGLKADGTVVAAGSNNSGQCDVSGWSNIVAISAGDHHTVGLKADGTMVAVGDDEYGQCKVDVWSGIRTPEISEEQKQKMAEGAAANMEAQYSYAESLLGYGLDADHEKIAEAREIFLQLGDYKDSKLYVSQMMEVLINVHEVKEDGWSDKESDERKYYNEYGLETRFYSDGREYNMFDEYGRLISAGDITYTYNEQGLLLSDGYYTYSYNSKGQLTEKTHLAGVYSYTYKYTYNSDGTLKAEAIYKDGVLQYTANHSYKYQDGLLVEYSRITNEKHPDKDYYKYYYDSEGQLIEEVRAGNADFRYPGVSQYTYDEAGKLIFMKFDDFDSKIHYDKTYTYGYIWAPKWQEIKES